MFNAPGSNPQANSQSNPPVLFWSTSSFLHPFKKRRVKAALGAYGLVKEGEERGRRKWEHEFTEKFLWINSLLNDWKFVIVFFLLPVLCFEFWYSVHISPSWRHFSICHADPKFAVIFWKDFVHCIHCRRSG